VVEDKPVTYSLTSSSLLAFTAGISELNALYPHVTQRLQKKGHQTTYSQRILLSFLRRGITKLTIGSKRSVIQYPA
jgi:hypothetical protein